jgi:phosphoglycerate kinase
MKLRTIDDLKDIRGKDVLVRVDHNVEFDQRGHLKDDRKLRVTVPTLEALLRKGGKLLLLTHVGRPEGKVLEGLRTKPIAEHLKTMSKSFKVMRTVRACQGEEVEQVLASLKPGEILYLENVRFERGEQENRPEFAEALAALADLYVNEAFAALHTYEETSTCEVARCLPAYAGWNLQKEVENLGRVTEDPRRPLTIIISGAKMKTKIPVIQRFLDLADHILLGGCVANTFLAARGFDVGNSKYEEGMIDLAQELMLESEKERKATIHVPRDVVVASSASEGAEKLDLPIEDLMGDMGILDIGKVTVERYRRIIAQAGSVIWNGPLGLYELNRFSHATKRIAEAIAEVGKRGAFTLIGGGDTLDFHLRYGYSLEPYGFVSTGGGAMLEFLSSPEPLPALAPLLKK